MQLTGLECHGYAGQPGRFITGACGVAGGLEEGPVLTATITSNPARASAHTAECRHSTEAAAQAESRQGTEVAGDAASAAATQVFVGVENMAVGVDLIAALMGAAESVAGAGTAVSTTATSVADETTVSAEGSSSSSAVGASTEGKGTAANETVAFHARLDNLSLLSVSDISGTGLGSSSTINSTGSRGSSSASLHCQALLSLSHLQCCWPPPSPSHSFSNPNTIDSNPPSGTHLILALTTLTLRSYMLTMLLALQLATSNTSRMHALLQQCNTLTHTHKHAHTIHRRAAARGPHGVRGRPSRQPTPCSHSPHPSHPSDTDGA